MVSAHKSYENNTNALLEIDVAPALPNLVRNASRRIGILHLDPIAAPSRQFWDCAVPVIGVCSARWIHKDVIASPGVAVVSEIASKSKNRKANITWTWCVVLRERVATTALKVL